MIGLVDLPSLAALRFECERLERRLVSLSDASATQPHVRKEDHARPPLAEGVVDVRRQRGKVADDRLIAAHPSARNISRGQREAGCDQQLDLPPVSLITGIRDPPEP